MIKDKNNVLNKRRVIGVMVVALALFIGYIVTHAKQMMTENVRTISYDPLSTETTSKLPLENDKEWVQTLVFPEKGMLNNIKIKIVEIPADISGSIMVSISGNGKILYSTEVPCTTLIDGTYFSMSGFTELSIDNIDLKVNGREKLYLSCVIRGNTADCPYLTVYQRKNSERLLINGILQKDRTLRLSYNVISYGRYYSIAIVLVVIIGILLWLIKLKEGAFYKIVSLCKITLPIFVMFIFLWLNDSLDYIKSIYVLVEVLLLYLVYIFLMGVLGTKAGKILFAVMSLAITLGNYYVRDFRGQPIMITDLFSARTAMTVAGNYVYQLTFPVIAVILIYLLLLLMLAYPESLKSKQGKKCIWLRRGVLILVSAGLYSCICYYTKVDLSGWSINESFEKYGWVYTNTKLIKSYINTTPDGYTRDSAEEFIKRETDNSQEFAGIVPLNLIVIMDESFSDLSVLGKFETNQEVLPYFDSLNNSSTLEKGWLGVHVFGGGTATTEWEVLAEGNSSFLDIGSLCPYNLLASGFNKYNYTGLCTAANEAGYYSIAMHPFDGKNYSRDKVYPLMGFQEYYNIDNYYENAESIRWCISDKADFESIIEQYENKKADKLFIFNVTMQNHGSYSYPMEKYDVYATDIESEELNSYLTLTHYTDEALKYLFSYFSEVDEPTMIVVFGDHQPTMTNDFYASVFGTADMTEQQDETRYVTPYVIWSNYERVTYNRPYINAGYLGAMIKAEAGLQLTEWDHYLLSVMDNYPVVGKNGVFDRQYNFVKYDKLDKEKEIYLKSMKYAQYYWWTNYYR